MAAIDLYSGIGGWTLGFQMAGIPVIASYEWWKDANETHNKNFGSHHKETDIRALELSDLPNRKKVQFVVGSPPCTQFSLANRGGNGDIKDGLVDIIKFLEVVEHLQPRYWAMENVPRVAKILEKGLKRGKLAKFRHLFKDIRVYNSSDFGVPQDRKRMIAGNFPFDLLDVYAAKTHQLNVADVLNALGQTPVVDPIYGIILDRAALSDHILEPNLSMEEARINQESKLHHPVYNRMSFPDRQDRPSRTMTALCTRVSRESVIIRDDQNNLRRLTVRERALMQSFPINYQFFGNTYANKIKMIGNAVPPLLTFYIAQSMQETQVANLMIPGNIPAERLTFSLQRAIDHIPDNEGANYAWNRTFWLAIQGLRFGSGVRFELKNYHDKETRSTTWRVNFFYGTSKQIEKKELDKDLVTRALRKTRLNANDAFVHLFEQYQDFLLTVDGQDLQRNWTNADRTRMGPIFLVDELARFATQFGGYLRGQILYMPTITKFITSEFNIETERKRPHEFQERAIDIFVGILIGAQFNMTMTNVNLEMRRPRVPA